MIKRPQAPTIQFNIITYHFSITEFHMHRQIGAKVKRGGVREQAQTVFISFPLCTIRQRPRSSRAPRKPGSTPGRAKNRLLAGRAKPAKSGLWSTGTNAVRKSTQGGLGRYP